MMVALVPDHVLEQQDGVIVVKIHVPACLNPALYRVPHRFGAVGEDVRREIEKSFDSMWQREPHLHENADISPHH
jgi:hypothetical protein